MGPLSDNERSRHVERLPQIAHSPYWMLDSVLRRLARDQWVRLHGTPRVTVLVGGERGREIWQRWLALSGAAGTLFAGEAAADAGAAGAAIDEWIRAAVGLLAEDVVRGVRTAANVVSQALAHRAGQGRG